MIKNLKILFLLFSCIILAGCSTLSYVGEDYNQNNISTVKTNEDFVFNVFKKTTQNANIKVGISKTPVMEVLALYIQIENLSYETPYIFKVENLRVSDSDRELQFITSNNYLNIFQNQEVASMGSMSSMGNTLSNMTGMMNNYNDINQQIIQSSAQASNDSTISKLDQVGQQILNHSVKYSSTISPRKSQYYYFFFENLEKYPITVKYKNLEYQFTL